MHRKFLVVLLALSAWKSAAAQDHDDGKPRRVCAPLSVLQIGTIKLSNSLDEVRRKLGSPIRVTNGVSEDDGGKYEVASYIYRHLQIDFGRSTIERLTTTSPQISMPRGVRIGMSEGQVAERLGFYPEIDTGTYKVRLKPCRVEGLEELVLTFHRSESALQGEARLVQVEVTKFGP